MSVAGGGVEEERDSESLTSSQAGRLRARALQNARKKPGLGSVKIEEFSHGRGEPYRRWKKAAEAAQVLYQLEEAEFALLLYLATRGKAREALDLMEIADLQEPGALNILLDLLDSAFEARDVEKV